MIYVQQWLGWITNVTEGLGSGVKLHTNNTYSPLLSYLIIGATITKRNGANIPLLLNSTIYQLHIQQEYCYYKPTANHPPLPINPQAYSMIKSTSIIAIVTDKPALKD